MAKKKQEQEQEQEQVISEQLFIQYDDLMAAKVRVVKDGVESFYLDPARTQGEFILRPIPQAVEEAGEIPEGWRRPTAEETAEADPKIDWKLESEPEAAEPVESEPEAAEPVESEPEA